MRQIWFENLCQKQGILVIFSDSSDFLFILLAKSANYSQFQTNLINQKLQR